MYIITLYTLNYYEDKYFISLFARFKYKARIYYYRTYTLTITKKKKLVIKVLKCIFWVRNFNVSLSFEMYFFREQFWDVFFEGAILMCTYALKCIFWGIKFDVNLCFEMYFLRKKFWNVFFEGEICLKLMAAD